MDSVSRDLESPNDSCVACSRDFGGSRGVRVLSFIGDPNNTGIKVSSLHPASATTFIVGVAAHQLLLG